MNTIYMDAAATSKPKLEVVEAMMPYLFGDKWYNPSSLYSPAVNVKNDIENARKIIANYINADTDEIYFTSGGSESNCWALQGFVNAWFDSRCTPVILTSNIEHKSIISCAKGNEIAKVHFINVDNDGYIDIDELERWLFYYTSNDEEYNHYKILVSIQFANNEIGTIQPMKEISDIVHYYGALLHTDAVQAFGQIHIDVNKLGIDMMSVSGHKIRTPKGIGFLYKKNDVEIVPLIFGSQEGELRGGTENVPYIIGMGKAVELADDNMKNINAMSTVRDYLIYKLKKIGCSINGSESDRLPNNVNVILPEGVGGEESLYLLDMSGIYIGVGSACNSKSKEPSHVLKSIGLTDEEAMRTIRITISQDTTINEIDCVVEEIKKCIMLLGGNM